METKAVRNDIKNLMEKISNNSFNYQEFDERFFDIEMLPIFKSVLSDPRILAAEQTRNLDHRETAHENYAFFANQGLGLPNHFNDEMTKINEKFDKVTSIFSRINKQNAKSGH